MEMVSGLPVWAAAAGVAVGIVGGVFALVGTFRWAWNLAVTVIDEELNDEFE